MRTTVGAFMAARLTVMCVYIIASFASFQHRPQVRLMAGLIFISLLIWIPLYFEIVSIRAKIAVAVVGIVFEEASWILAYGPWIKKKLSLQYSTAVDITHEIDRFATCWKRIEKAVGCFLNKLTHAFNFPTVECLH